MQSRVQRAVLNLKDFFRSMLDRVGDGVPMGGSQDQRLQHQHIESSLEHLGLKRRLTSGHVFQYTPLDDLLEQLTTRFGGQ